MATRELPNGQIAEFPDSMSSDQIDGVIRQKFPTHSQGLPKNENNSFVMEKFDPSFIDTLAPNILAGLATGGEALLKAPSNLGKYAASKGIVSNEFANAIPRPEDHNFAEMLKLQPNLPNKIVQG